MDILKEFASGAGEFLPHAIVKGQLNELPSGRVRVFKLPDSGNAEGHTSVVSGDEDDSDDNGSRPS